MPQCAVINCNNTHRKTKGGSVRYHRFPGDGETRARWIRACGRHVLNCATARICSRHFSDRSYERDVQHELLGLPTRCRLKKGSIPDKNLPAEAQEDHQVDSAIAVLLAVGLVPNAQVQGRKSGGLPQDLNKMHIMEDVREACDAQPSSPGHADQRPELENGFPSDVEIHQEKLSTNGDPYDTTENGCESPPSNHIKKRLSEAEEEDNCSNGSTSESMKRKAEPEEWEHKKIKTEMEENFSARDRILTDYLSSVSLGNLDQIQTQMEQIIVEIRTLNELAKEKEKEWNHIIYLKKMKEEMLLRVQRQKQILLLSSESNGQHDGNENRQDDRVESMSARSILKQKNTNAQRSGRFPSQEKMGPRSILNRQNSLEVNGQVVDYRQGKQRNVVDVQSIIADYRQRHPETVPRRGRRIRSVLNSSNDKSSGVLNFSSLALGSGSQNRHDDRLGDGQNAQDMTSFKDMLVQFAKLSQTERQEAMQNNIKPPPPYPEVTVHPVVSQNPSSSLLHGILTKAHSKADSKSTFSPTLARLLTAPERAAMGPQVTSTPISSALPQGNVSISEILTGSKVKSSKKVTRSREVKRLCQPFQGRNEITITPVCGQFEGNTKMKGGNHAEEEEAEDSVDRLVIDEGGELADGRSRNDNSSDNGDEVPQCQGCNQRAAQFVCAGCGNQWYCSRDCQVSAWDDHSEVCSG